MADLDKLLTAVRTAIQEDPTISDPTKIMVSAQRNGPIFRKQDVILLEGSVRYASEVDKVADIVSRKAPSARIENSLVAE